VWPFKKKTAGSRTSVKNVRRYAASVVDRLNPKRASNLSANGEIFTSLAVLRNRSRQLERDNEYAKKFYHMVESNVIGTDGITLQARARDDRGALDTHDNERIEAAWRDWSKPALCSTTRQLSWIDIQNLAIKAVARDGEVLIQLVPGFENEYKFALHIIEADHLDENYNLSTPEKRVVMGVELDQWDAPIAYNLRAKHPGDDTHSFFGKNYRRVPAEQIIHLYKTDRPGQVRGVPWMHAVMKNLNQTDGYIEAELVAARTAASKMGFFKSDTGDAYVGDDTQATGEMITDAEPGAFEELPGGVDFVAYDPQHPTTAFSGFMKTVIRGAASGLNVSYESLSNDREGVNFSSIRSGVIDERDQWRTLQKWVSTHLHHRVYQAWLKHCLTAQTLPLPPRKFKKFLDVIWQARGWTWVDPLKDQQAQKMSEEMGTQTLTAICAAQGRDFEDICAQRAREQKILDKYGLKREEVANAKED